MSFLKLLPRPITLHEFANEFRLCTSNLSLPGNKIAIANSGGPDSTGLLFLLHRHFKQYEDVQTPSLVSLTVDHALQPSSENMATICEQNARKLGVVHTTSRIPWGHHPFPDRPSATEPMENVARLSRYHILLHGMKQTGAATIAFGHHADDQVETALMRSAKGSSDYGQAAMRPCRRWGMGLSAEAGNLGWAGLDGMDKWIIRPLLNFSKDRILATCEENDLEYVIDKTNFQPALTLRNAIRHKLSGHQLPEDLPSDIQRNMHTIAASFTRDMHKHVRELRVKADAIDHEVEAFVARHRLPSPPGTALFSLRAFHEIGEGEKRLALVYSILRAVSPHPWGSLEAEAKHRSRKSGPLMQSLWQTAQDRSLHPFSGPASVMWTPTALIDRDLHTERLEACWLASRQPPSRAKAPSLTIELSDPVTQAVRDNQSLFTILYDCRFAVHFDLQKAPPGIVDNITRGDIRLFIESSHRLVYPLIKAQARDGSNTVLFQWVSDTPTLRQKSIQADCSSSNSAWISIDWARSFT